MKKLFIWILTLAIMLIGNINTNAAQNNSDNIIWLEEGIEPLVGEKGDAIVDEICIGGFTDELAVVYNTKNINSYEDIRYGCINEKGELKIPFKYTEIFPFSDGIARVEINDTEYGFINSKDERLTYIEKSNEFTGITPFCNGFACVCKDSDNGKNRKWGYINTAGKIVVPIRYDEFLYFKEGKCFAKRDDKWFCIDENGTEIFSLPDNHRPISGYQEGKVAVQYTIYEGEYLFKQYYCYYDDKGNKLFDAGEQSLNRHYRDFSEGRVIIINGDSNNDDYPYKYSVVDEKGDVIVAEGIYKNISNFKDGHAWAIKNDSDTIYIIDLNGNVIKEINGYKNPGYYYMFERFELFAQDAESGLWGMLDQNGNILIPFEYDFVWQNIRHGKTFVEKDGRWGIYTLADNDNNMITIYGDADFDGKVTVNDASVTLSKILDNNNVIKLEKETGDYKKYLDVDNDDILTATDVAIILRKALEKDNFIMPVEK